MSKILITGGSGTIGTALSALLVAKGHEVSHLSRKITRKEKYRTYLWDWENETIEPEAIDTAEFIIHLAGAGIMDEPWTSDRMRIISDSRVRSGRFLLKVIRQRSIQLKAFISASAVGYYGASSSEHVFSELDPPSDDFLANVCKDWETMADEYRTIGVRSVKLRTAVVISEKTELISNYKKAAQMGLLAPLGSGSQYMPWIHIDDLCAIYLKSLEDPVMSGAYNAAAPMHVTNKEFTLEFARAMDKKVFLPRVPSFLLKIMFGERSRLLLRGSRISSEKILKTGFVFLYPKLQTALKKALINN